MFYLQSCPEENGLSLDTKAKMLLSAFPCIPSGITFASRVSANDALNECISMYNELSETLEKANSCKGIKYKRLNLLT